MFPDVKVEYGQVGGKFGKRPGIRTGKVFAFGHHDHTILIILKHKYFEPKVGKNKLGRGHFMTQTTSHFEISRMIGFVVT